MFIGRKSYIKAQYLNEDFTFQLCKNVAESKHKIVWACRTQKNFCPRKSYYTVSNTVSLLKAPQPEKNKKL